MKASLSFSSHDEKLRACNWGHPRTAPEIGRMERWRFSRCENQRRAERRNGPARRDARPLPATAAGRAEFSQRENSHLLGGSARMRPLQLRDPQ